MYKGRKILAVITARGGSKDIPKKNIKLLAGKPLIVYTIQAAKDSRYLDDWLVSTDSPEIAKISKRYGAPVPFLRPAELATDSAKSIPVVLHALDWLAANRGQEYDYTLILQPTSPLRTAQDIDQAIKKAVDGKADSVMGMVQLTDISIPKLKKLKGDRILPLADEEGKTSQSRQEPMAVYKRNCAIYLTKVSLLRRNDLFGKKSLAYVMPAERSVDINTPLDFLITETLLKQKQK